ncbi:YkgJ family cysteine cluster protein [Labilibacter marinus]|uniref:YkgJ family cysteine cluster protein n=1 Tax=Labilibacter marinus TaxID=1477105 RepID=UPI000833E2EB|nr:YkgJ family cysteine cluster protein [Labilibacter marinus]
MDLEIDLKRIDALSKQRREENIEFRFYLEGQDVEKIDNIVHRLNDEISSKIDCVECGNCCLNIRPAADEMVLARFVKDEDIEKVKYVWGFACKNLDGKKCTIYQDRYHECRDFPYLDTDDFIHRVHGVVQNYEICPIVFNVYERLKTELAWKRK